MLVFQQPRVRTHGCKILYQLRAAVSETGGIPQILLKEAKQASPWMMLCGIVVAFNSLGDVLGLMAANAALSTGRVSSRHLRQQPFRPVLGLIQIVRRP